MENNSYDDIEEFEQNSIYSHILSDQICQSQEVSKGNERLIPANKDQNLKKFIDYLKCFICYQQVKEPVMCPGCSGFACHGCLSVWIQQNKSECPICRKDLQINQIIKC